MAWAATNAKAKFSEVLDKAESDGPQIVQRRKREFVLMTREQHEALLTSKRSNPKSFVSAWDALKPSFAERYDVDFTRVKSRPRKVDLG